jgi:prefoldin subunit 5
MLLNEFQKQYRRSEAQAELIQGQQQQIEARQSRLSHLESMIEEGHTGSSQVAGLTNNPRRVEGH